MPWVSANLSASMGGVVAKANAAIADLQKTMAQYDRQIQANLDIYGASLDAVAASRTLINKLQSAGIYTLILSPGSGAWASRMQSAANQPSNSGYCCGFANIVMAANPQAALQSLTKLKASFEKRVSQTADSIMNDIVDISNMFTPEDIPADLELFDTSAFAGKTLDDLFTPDTWHSATMGDVFGGAMQVVADELNAVAKAGQSLLKHRNMISATRAYANMGLSTVNAFLDDLTSTGTYSIMLEPAAGGYLSRLSAEQGAPPNDPAMYSAGIVCIATAPSAASLVDKFDTITSLIGG